MNENTLAAARQLFQTDKGETLEDLASNSNVRFVRSQFQLAVARPDATGFIITALAALNHYGWNKLSELIEYTSTALIDESGEPKASFLRRANELGLDFEMIQRSSGWGSEESKDFLNDKQVRFRQLDRLAASLGIKQPEIGRRLAATSNDLGARLRSLKTEGRYTLTEDVVASAALASRLSADHADLLSQHGAKIIIRDAVDKKIIINELAAIREQVKHYVAHQQGHALADFLRDRLGYRRDQSINHMANLIENRLGILLLFSTLRGNVTGISVENSGERAILINNAVYGSDIFIRRNALAHELCHILVDSYEEFATIKVDQDRIFDDNIARVDRTEARANAFAAQFLAPQQAVCDFFIRYGSNTNAINRLLFEFGVSATVIKRQLENGLGISLPNSNPITLRETAHSKWLSQERPIHTRIPVRFGLKDIRKNRLSIIALLLLQHDVLTDDEADSILGYPGRNPREIAEKIFSIGYFKQRFNFDAVGLRTE